MEDPARRPPTSDEATSNAQLDSTGRTFALWVPQIGGYAAVATVTFTPTSDGGSCYALRVYHDGEFPTNGEGPGLPTYVELHGCDVKQLAQFAETMAELVKRVKT